MLIPVLITESVKVEVLERIVVGKLTAPAMGNNFSFNFLVGLAADHC